VTSQDSEGNNPLKSKREDLWRRRFDPSGRLAIGFLIVFLAATAVALFLPAEEGNRVFAAIMLYFLGFMFLGFHDTKRLNNPRATSVEGFSPTVFALLAISVSVGFAIYLILPSHVAFEMRCFIGWMAYLPSHVLLVWLVNDRRAKQGSLSPID